MFKTKQEALAAVALVNDENYFSFSVDRRDPLSCIWSKSELKRFACDTLEWISGAFFPTSAKMDFGNLVDTMATEPEKFASRYFITTETDKRKKAYLEAKAEAEQRNLKVATLHDVTRAEKAIAALQGHPDGLSLLKGRKQAVLTGVLAVDGPLGKVWIPLKAKTDSIVQNDNGITIIDLKTTEDSSPAKLPGLCRHLSYHWQDALYTILAKQQGYDVEGFKFVFVSTDDPFHVQSASFSEHARIQALISIERTLKMLYFYGHGHALSAIWPREVVLGSDEWAKKANIDFWFTGPELSPFLPEVQIEW